MSKFIIVKESDGTEHEFNVEDHFTKIKDGYVNVYNTPPQGGRDLIATFNNFNALYIAVKQS